MRSENPTAETFQGKPERTGRHAAAWSAGLLAVVGVGAAAIAVTGPAPAGLPELPAVPPYRAMPPQPPVQAGQWVAVNAFPNLTFTTPTFLTYAPRSDRLYVLEREGVVKCFENDPKTSAVVTVLDIQDHCQGMSDCGLVGLAFHPDFGKPGSPNRGYFYLFYNYTDDPVRAPNLPSVDKVTHDRLSRFTVPDGSLVADPKSELVLIDEVDRNLYHTGGGMFFHPRDGFLYLSVGDEGGGRGILGNCQRIDRNLYGGVLRIDVDMDPARSHPIRRQPKDGTTAHYYVPNDNPFVGVPDALEEFWCLGLRSPHRMTYDPVTGKVWLGDVGDGGGDPREEVDLIEKGGNYQWNYMEGTAARPEYAPRPAKIIGVEKPPLYEYPHTDGNRCIIGGYVYRGREHAAALGGKYVFGDFGSGRVWTLTERAGEPPAVAELCMLPVASCYLSSFGVDRDGELYLCEIKTGRIFKLARAGSAAAPLTATRPIPPRLSETGVFADTRRLIPAAGMIPYSVNCPLWSDGAVKSRWVSVPHQPGVAVQPRIDFAATGDWTFPAGTVFVKHFELAADETDPAVRKRLETRLLVRDPEGSVYGVTYKWRPDNSDADLLTAALQEQFTVRTAGGERKQTWTYPSPQNCLECHNANANFVLGVNTRQLNRPHRYDATGITDNQLRTWGRLGLFGSPPRDEEIDGFKKLVAVNDGSASLGDRVRSYLDANCAYCHRPNGAHALFDARYDTPPEKQGIVEGPVQTDLGVHNARVIAAKDDGRSLLYERMKSTASIKMPPLGRNLRDVEATEAVRQWISSLPVRSTHRKPWKQLAGLGGAFAGALVVAGLLRRRLRQVRQAAGRAWVAWAVPVLVALGVPAVGLVRGMAHLARGQDGWLLLGVSAGAALLAFVLFGRGARRRVQAGRLLAEQRPDRPASLPSPPQATDDGLRRAAG